MTADKARVRRRTAGSKGSRGDADGLVVYVHGIGRKPHPEALKLEWDLALFGRDMGGQARMAYWADVLHGHDYAESTADDQLATQSVSRSKSARRLAPDLETALEVAGVEGTDALAFAHGLAEALGDRPRGPGTAGLGKRVLPLPGFVRKPISEVFLRAFVVDTAAYFFKKGVRRRIQQRLRSALPPAGTPFTLVAHSQGTIVVFEVLSSRDGDAVRQLVTLGSPLGIREVQDFLVPPDLQIPLTIERWSNFADPLDPVALDKDLGDDFRGAIAIDDSLLINNRTIDVPRFNPHSSVGYLSHPKVREVVHRAARFDSMSRFVAARDVVERLGAQGRHPVLIEILEPHYAAVDESPKEMKRMETRVEKDRIDLATRIDRAAGRIEALVADPEAARVDRLRRFVAAHLTASEIRDVAGLHRELRIYAMWRSSTKRKLLWRSTKVLQADAARISYGASGKDITWAVLDTGVHENHPHFAGNGAHVIKEVWDCTKTGPPIRLAKAADQDGHGTHVAGIIAGRDPAGTNVGLAPEATLVVYKVLDDKGRGEDAWIIKALDHIAIQNENVANIGIHGLNLSLGGPYDSTVYGCGYSPICQELRRLWRSGVLVVVSCGNEGQLAISTPNGDAEINSVMSIGDPANLEDCIAVGSVNAERPHLYGVSAFSSRGPTSDGRAKPDVVAPGERISSCNAFWDKAVPDSLYREESGTSMSAPHVSGLLAAYLSVRREFRGRPDEVKRILLESCTDLGRDRYHQGRGVPNLMRMLLSV